jgi:hypothetical protein
MRARRAKCIRRIATIHKGDNGISSATLLRRPDIWAAEHHSPANQIKPFCAAFAFPTIAQSFMTG